MLNFVQKKKFLSLKKQITIITERILYKYMTVQKYDIENISVFLSNLI